MVKLAFNAVPVQKDAPKDEEKCEVLLIVPEEKDSGDVVPARQRRACCWCMGFGLVFVLASVIFGGAYLYQYFASQQRDAYFCGVDNIQDFMPLSEPSTEPSAPQYRSNKEGTKILEEGDAEFASVPISDGDSSQMDHALKKDDTTFTELHTESLESHHRFIKETIEILLEELAEFASMLIPEFRDGDPTQIFHDFNENNVTPAESTMDSSESRHQSMKEDIEILPEEDVVFINVPVPEFGDHDPSRIFHDFNKNITVYLDLNLDKCYVIPLNTSVVMPPKSLLEMLRNIQAGKYMPHTYLIHEQMIVTKQIENVDHLGAFVSQLCHGKETYKLKRKETTQGIQKREAGNCRRILHYEGRLAVDTVICDQ